MLSYRHQNLHTGFMSTPALYGEIQTSIQPSAFAQRYPMRMQGRCVLSEPSFWRNTLNSWQSYRLSSSPGIRFVAVVVDGWCSV